jgi:pilus assembly protein CpaC
MKPLHRLLGLAALLLASLTQATAPALAQMEPLANSTQVDLGTAGGGARNLSIPRGKSAIIDLPVDARDVLVTNPQVADAVLRSPRRIYVMGLTPGVTDAEFFDAGGRRILALNIRVDQDFSAVAQTINRLIPDAHVRVEGVNNSLVLTGEVTDLSEADKAVQIAQQFTTTPAQVLNMLAIDGKEQVMLKVRIVEMQRTVIKQLGFNLSALIGQAGNPQFLVSTAANFAVNGALLGGLNAAGFNLNTTSQPELQEPCGPGFPQGTLCPVVVTKPSQASNFNAATSQPTAGSNGLNKAGATIDAFEQVGLVRTLAEPNLTAVSGESAKFLAGGEFPVPSGIASNGQVSVDFKTFGVGLGFTPVVLSGGRISLKISTEVSELTNQGSFTLATGSGSGGSTTGSAALTIPGLNVRRAETTIELPSGGSMMIAGLLNEETKQDISSLPGMMNLPVLGALFNSRDYQEGETELVVIVTPYLVNPTSPANLQTPADGFQVANDAQTVLLGRLNKVYKTPAAAVAGKTYQGPVGYVIE